MKFNKNKGWVFEELEKKNECLDADCFGGENPEDVEKQREKNEKEINKRFEGTRKNAEKVVGDDFEEKAKPHKVEEQFKNRKDLAEAIKQFNDNHIEFKVRRSTQEGYRYVVEYFSDAHKKDESLFEKIDLEEDVLTEKKNTEYSRELAELLIDNGFDVEEVYASSWYSGPAFVWIKVLNATDEEFARARSIAEKYAESISESYFPVEVYISPINDHKITLCVNKNKKESIKEDLYTKQDVFNALNAYIDVLEDDRRRTPAGESNDILRNVIGALKDIVNDFNESLKESNGKFALVVNGEWYATFDSYEKADEAKERFNSACSDEEDSRSYYGSCPDIKIVEIKDESLKETFVDEVLPDAIPEEPIVVSTEPEAETIIEEPSEEVKENGIYMALSSELRDTLSDIENLKSLTVTLVNGGKEDIIDDLNAIIDDRTIHVGMLQTLMEKVDAKVEDEPIETSIEEPVEESLGIKKPSREMIADMLRTGALDDPEHVKGLSDEEFEELVSYWVDNYNTEEDHGELENEALVKELEAGDCAYHPERDEYYYLKKTNKPNKFELYTHSDSKGFEVASPRFIDKNSPFYNKLKLHTKNANPEFKESLEEDDFEIIYDRRAVEKEYGLEDGELDGVSIRDAEEMIGEEEGALDRFIESLNEEKTEVFDITDADQKKIKKWWKDVETANDENNWGFNIINDYNDVDGMYSAIFDMCNELKDLDKNLYRRGKRLYNKYGISQVESLELEEDKEPDEGPEHGYASVEDYKRSQEILDEMSTLRKKESEEGNKLIKVWAVDKTMSYEEFHEKSDKLHKETQDKIEKLFKELKGLTDKAKENK